MSQRFGANDKTLCVAGALLARSGRNVLRRLLQCEPMLPHPRTMAAQRCSLQEVSAPLLDIGESCSTDLARQLSGDAM